MAEVSAPDIVYINKPGDENPELRYSLRSLANLPHGTVWISGYIPSWVTGVREIHVHRVTGWSKYRAATTNLRAAVTHRGVSERFYLFNDDFYILTEIDEVPMLNRGPVDEVIDSYARRQVLGDYVAGMAQSRDLLYSLGVPEPLSYELHIPMPLDKRLMIEVLDLCRGLACPHWRTVYGNLHCKSSPTMQDVKSIRSDDPLIGTTYASTNTLSTKGVAGRALRHRFPNRCSYERF